MYAIIRTQKHTSNATIGGMEKHVDRTMDVPNANPNVTKYNKHILGTEGTLIESIDSKIEQLKKEHNPRITKSSVKCIEYMMTASPEAFPNKVKDNQLLTTPEGEKRWRQFVKNSLDFLTEKHGRQNIVKFTIHLDETTPHIHAFVVPITKDNRLSAKEFLGGKKKMQELQNDFAKIMKPLGLKRGEMGSKVEHENIQQYYGRVNQAQHMNLVGSPLEKEYSKPYELPKPPAIGRESWRSEQEVAINEEIKQLQISLSNERSDLNRVKDSLREERITVRSKDAKIKKLEARIWHLENPEQSKKLAENKKLEQQILKGKNQSRSR